MCILPLILLHTYIWFSLSKDKVLNSQECCRGDLINTLYFLGSISCRPPSKNCIWQVEAWPSPCRGPTFVGSCMGIDLAWKEQSFLASFFNLHLYLGKVECFYLGISYCSLSNPVNFITPVNALSMCRKHVLSQRQACSVPVKKGIIYDVS